MKLRVVIADDEPLARERLRHFLESEPGSEVVAECANGQETLHAIKSARPDLVFLDVKMPGLDGFDVVANLKGITPPVVIFVTAHEEFAVRAFEVNAVDYLMKPFDRTRFQAALRRARARLRGGRPIRKKTVRLATFAGHVQPLERVVVKAQGRIVLLNTDEIDWICAADNYAELHVGKTSHLLRMTLTALAEQLPRDRFLRISRSHLVNAERIKEIRPKSHGDSSVVLRDGTTLLASRNYRQNLIRLFSGSR